MRRKKNIKSDKLLHDLNISRNSLGRIETGLREDSLNNKSIQTLKTVIEYLNIKDDIIFNNDYLKFLLFESGKKIEISRMNMKLSKRQLAINIGVCRDTITRWENESVIITKENYLKLKKELGI